MRPFAAPEEKSGAEEKKKVDPMRNHTKLLARISKSKSNSVQRGAALHSLLKLDLSDDKSGVPVMSDSGMMNVMSALVNPEETYTFRLAYTHTIATDAAGNVLTFLPWDPTGISEYTAVSSLFSQVRLREARVTANGISGDGNQVYVSSYMNSSGSAPSSFSAVITIPDCVGWSPYNTAINQKKSSPIHPNKLWADISTPSPGPDQGCFGQWYIATDHPGSFSVDYFQCLVELFLDFRGRY